MRCCCRRCYCCCCSNRYPTPGSGQHSSTDGPRQPYKVQHKEYDKADPDDVLEKPFAGEFCIVVGMLNLHRSYQQQHHRGDGGLDDGEPLGAVVKVDRIRRKEDTEEKAPRMLEMAEPTTLAMARRDDPCAIEAITTTNSSHSAPAVSSAMSVGLTPSWKESCDT